jgi:hypothetical protein
LTVMQAAALLGNSVSAGVRFKGACQQPIAAVFREGKSRATDAGGTGPSPRIAHVDGTSVWLDFGAVSEGNSNNSPEVLLIDNPGDIPYALSASLSTDIRTLFSVVSLAPESLPPGGTSTLGMKLDTHGVAPGSYEGTLTVADLFGSFTKEIQVRVKVLAPSEKQATEDEQGVPGGPRASTGTPRVRIAPVVPEQNAPKPRITPDPDPDPEPDPDPAPDPPPAPEPEADPEPPPSPDVPPSLP